MGMKRDDAFIEDLQTIPTIPAEEHDAKANFDDKSSQSALNTPALGSVNRGVDESPNNVVYRLYRWRFVGLIALVLLNIVGGMPAAWFGPIANNLTHDFGLSLDEVNWLSNVVNIIYLPSSLVVPLVCKRWGLRMTCYVGAVILVVASWIRYAGTAQTLSKTSSLCLLMLGQIIAGIAQPAFQVLGPLYSEKWFNLQGRTTATMVLSIANPLGTAIAQIISPVVGSTKTSILVIGVIATAIAPCALLMRDAPPTPPTYAAAQKSPSLNSLVRAMIGREPQTSHVFMTIRERIDFSIIILIFGVLVGVINTFTILTAQDLEPYGYSSDTSGFMGAALFLVGLVAAAVTSPLFDRVLTHHLALTCQVLCPIIGILWLSLIWAVKPNDTVALYVILAIIGACSVTILPVSLELAVEVTRNADASCAILWACGNLFSITFVLAEGALRAGPEADPPLNMHRAIIFQGIFLCVAICSVAGLRGKQARRERDEQQLHESTQVVAMIEHLPA